MIVTEKNNISLERKKLLAELVSQRAKADRLESELSDIKDHSEKLQTELTKIQQELLQTKRSLSWKITLPLRKVPKLSRFSKQILKWFWRRIIFSLPSHRRKKNIPQQNLPISKKEFDKKHYLKWNPDVAATGVDPYTHYITFGRQEGRPGHSDALRLHEKKIPLDKEKGTILVVNHEASRTGAPILGWNICRELKNQFNVIGFLFGGGSIFSFFKETCDALAGPYDVVAKNPFMMSYIISQLHEKFNFKFAIVNSIESRYVLTALGANFIPSVLLIHEFYSYSRPQTDFVDALMWAGVSVFSARIVQENALNAKTKAMIAASYILPQGKSQIPIRQSKNKEAPKNSLNELKEQIFINNHSKPFIVLGAGGVYYRKGVDLFISTALEVKKINPKSDILMLWIGHGFDPEIDVHYSAYIADQIERSNLQENFKIIREISNLEDIYQIVDLFFLSSRLDPLPNVAIDVMKHGVPVICFENSTGISEFLEKDPETATCIIPFLNTFSAAQKIIDFYQSPQYRLSVSKKIKEMSETTFEMKHYVAELLKLAENQVPLVKEEKLACETLEKSDDFIESFFSQPTMEKLNRQHAIRNYIRSWYGGFSLRKPAPGFNSEIYAKYHNLDATQCEPFVHYLRSKKPKGPWLDEVFKPLSSFKLIEPQLRCAVHIHVFYPQLLRDILDRFQANRLRCDLFISVPSEDIANRVSNLLVDYNKGSFEIRTVPNRGRDIGPFFTEFAEKLQEYDVVGHFHTKRSLDINNRNAVQAWVKFLLENLIGGDFKVADQIIDLFKKDPSIGLVFADDPNLLDWGKNKPFAEQLTDRLGLHDLPDCCFNFPVGTMFWARPAALKPLFDLKFSWEMYPTEPLPYDGSLLHTLERLLPLVTEHQKFKKVVTYIPGLTR